MAIVKHTTLLQFLFILFIPVDMINGELIRSGLPSLSFFYKMFVLVVVSLYLVNKGYLLFLIAIGSTVIAYVVIHGLIMGDFSRSVSSSVMLIRFFSITVFFVFFVHLIRLGDENYLFSIALLSFLFLVLNVLLGFWGFGHGMYGGVSEYSIGTRGFIYAGNEIGVAIVVSGSIVMMRCLEDNRFFRYSIVGLILIASSAFLASKTPLLMSAVVTIVYPIIHLIVNKSDKWVVQKSSLYFSLSSGVLFFSLAFFSFYYALYYSGLINRLVFFYERLDLLTLIFSSRNVWLSEAYSRFLSDYSLVEYIFGSGNEWLAYISGNKVVEIDPMDFLMYYGLIGFLIVYGFVFGCLIKSYRSRLINNYGLYVSFSTVLLIFVSSTAGHVFYSGTAGFLISILFAFSYAKNRFS